MKTGMKAAELPAKQIPTNGKNQSPFYKGAKSICQIDLPATDIALSVTCKANRQFQSRREGFGRQ